MYRHTITSQMRRYKKPFSVMLVVALVICMVTPCSAATKYAAVGDSESTEMMDSLDILLAAFRVLGGEAESESAVWENISGIRDIQPLYDVEHSVIAYYLAFDPYGYAIINNNLNNPIVMEYSPVNNVSMDSTFREVKTSEKASGEVDFVWIS